MTVQVNDVLFRTSRYTHLAKVKVTKITPSGNIRLSDNSLLTPDLRKKTTDAWDNTIYYLWSQELEDKYRLLQLQSEVKTKLAKLNIDNLNESSLIILSQHLDDIMEQ